eukprot:3095307-Alexandrium_andersonii.AAC.1
MDSRREQDPPADDWPGEPGEDDAEGEDGALPTEAIGRAWNGPGTSSPTSSWCGSSRSATRTATTRRGGISCG